MNWDELKRKIERDGLRNVSITTTRPADTQIRIAMVAGQTNGIEPSIMNLFKGRSKNEKK